MSGYEPGGRSIGSHRRGWTPPPPAAVRRLDDLEMQYVASMYFGVDVPALEAVAGKVGSARYSVGVIDPQGSVLTCNSRMTSSDVNCENTAIATLYRIIAIAMV